MGLEKETQMEHNDWIPNVEEEEEEDNNKIKTTQQRHKQFTKVETEVSFVSVSRRINSYTSFNSPCPSPHPENAGNKDREQKYGTGDFHSLGSHVSYDACRNKKK